MKDKLILRLPTNSEFDNWLEDSCKEFADDTAFAEGITFEQAYNDIKKKSSELLPNGKDTKGTVIKVFDTNDYKNGGFVWFGKLPPLKDNQIFLYQITITEKLRGMGYGKKLLIRMHEELKKMGYNSIYLNVMKRNYAIKLYTALGYKIKNDFEHNYIMSIEL